MSPVPASGSPPTTGKRRHATLQAGEGQAGVSDQRCSLQTLADRLTATLGNNGPRHLVKQALADAIHRIDIHPHREATPWFNVPTQTPQPTAGECQINGVTGLA